MHTIQLDIPDELAERLEPYSDHLLALLELGLQAWMAHEQQEHGAVREGPPSSRPTSSVPRLSPRAPLRRYPPPC